MWIIVAVIAWLIISGNAEVSVTTSSNVGQSVIDALANAIAQAEGYIPGSAALPVRANNPGDLEIGDRGSGTIAGKTVFPTIEAGWQALKNQISAMLDGSSQIYNPGMTIQDVANLYTGGDQANSWAANVAASLGVSTATTLADLQNQFGGAA